MKENEDGRRSFLKHLMAGTAVVAGVEGTRKSAQAKKTDAPSDQSETLYKETEAFKQYYKSLRY